jgi:hypothetical protein
MAQKNKFGIGEIVTFRTHPLLYNREIRGDGKLIPPFMVVKEIFFETKKKKVADDVSGKKIAERIKYTCIFFDDNRSEFKEVFLYESMLVNYTKFHIARKDGKPDDEKNTNSLIEEVSQYKTPKYKYSKIVYFKTKKLEMYKKRKSFKQVFSEKEGESDQKTYIQYVVNFASPEFILCGYKQDTLNDMFYPDGSPKRILSNILFKIKWFNSSQMKFSEFYIPKECLIDEQPFETLVPHK